ncbi:MAG: hypothetical protein M0R48_01440 [Candidatus Omnitrophica bacterium]|jgi:hypothetical protein|nr:hypothetical protein [Candidatus Omnitrophota bacterium]
MMDRLEQYLLDAQGKEKEEISSNNPYGKIGFDSGKKRLGWVRVTPFNLIKDSLLSISPLLKGKENFIFVGMGGSINGIKTLFFLFKRHKLFTLDSLDPAATEAILKKIKNIDKTLVISISKSGTTQETQLLSLALRESFGSNWSKHFLWLADPSAFEKLETLGWKGAQMRPIQFDAQADVGGRFSCPHTLIFFLPLFLLLKQDIGKLKQVYDIYLSSQALARHQAYLFAEKYKDKEPAYFFPQVKGNLGESFSSWIVQLFQESLGSKKENFSVKTTGLLKVKNSLFLPIKLKAKINNPVASLMSQMYFFQAFVAFYSAFKDINFVDQEFVEKYKDAMRKIEGSKTDDINLLDLAQIIKEVKGKISTKQKFIEVVLYFYPSKEIIAKVRQAMSRAFSDRMVFVFVGSDWNHHSYQAAFADKNTFYVFLLASSYLNFVEGISQATLVKNIEKLKIISKATHLTLEDKSLLFRFSR